MAAKRRPVQLLFRVTPQERERVLENMKSAGAKNIGAYLRKVALNGYVVCVDTSGLKELTFLLRRASANLNQLAVRVNETGNIYAEDIADLRERYDRLWGVASSVAEGFEKIKVAENADEGGEGGAGTGDDGDYGFDMELEDADIDVGADVDAADDIDINVDGYELDMIE